MQKYFEKIKERFRTYTGKINLDFGKRGKYDFMEVDSAIEIVNQVAVEYKTECNSSRLEDGWIPCGDRLPTDGEVHECTAQFSTGMLYIEYSYYDIAREEWWAHDDTGLVNVIAWREHPEPYQPKGE